MKAGAGCCGECYSTTRCAVCKEVITEGHVTFGELSIHSKCMKVGLVEGGGASEDANCCRVYSVRCAGSRWWTSTSPTKIFPSARKISDVLVMYAVSVTTSSWTGSAWWRVWWCARRTTWSWSAPGHARPAGRTSRLIATPPWWWGRWGSTTTVSSAPSVRRSWTVRWWLWTRRTSPTARRTMTGQSDWLLSSEIDCFPQRIGWITLTIRQKVHCVLWNLQAAHPPQERSNQGSQDPSSWARLSHQLLQVRGLPSSAQLRGEGEGMLAHQTSPAVLPVSTYSCQQCLRSCYLLFLYQVLQEETERKWAGKRLRGFWLSWAEFTFQLLFILNITNQHMLFYFCDYY